MCCPSASGNGQTVSKKDGHGAWKDQPENVRQKFFNMMYQDLWDYRFELDDVIVPAKPETNAWKELAGKTNNCGTDLIDE